MVVLPSHRLEQLLLRAREADPPTVKALILNPFAARVVVRH